MAAKNSTQPVNDFITALGEGDPDCTNAKVFSTALPSQEMKDIAHQVIARTNLNPSKMKVQPSTDDTTVQKPEEFESLLPNQLEEQTNLSKTASDLRPKQ